MTAPTSVKLADLEFFAGLDREYVDFLAEHASERQFEQDELLFRHDEPAGHFYLVLGGSVVLEVPAITGPALEVQQVGEGHVLGWSWLIPPYKWSFNARAEVPATVLEFDGKPILARCEKDPQFGYQLLRRFSALMSERLEAARLRMIDQWNPPGFA
jgi:CRP/FNR family transcriptional regulator, cyclic AMP receptor protein